MSPWDDASDRRERLGAGREVYSKDSTQCFPNLFLVLSRSLFISLISHAHEIVVDLLSELRIMK